MANIRNLHKDEIDVRIAQCSDKGVSLLLYKDARVDQRILDEAFGEMNWQRSHQLIGDRLYCTVSVWDKDKGWVSKQDVGVESYTEAEKGQASDSFKRACFNWGIGRELYSAPFIWVSADKVNLKENNKGKYACYDKFAVQRIEYNDKNEISYLEVVNLTKKIGVFKYGTQKAK